MKRNTLFILVGLGATYFYLTSRIPIFAKALDGTYQPAGLLDRLTVALTGAQPPSPQQITVNVPGIANVSYTS